MGGSYYGGTNLEGRKSVTPSQISLICAAWGQNNTYNEDATRKSRYEAKLRGPRPAVTVLWATLIKSASIITYCQTVLTAELTVDRVDPRIRHLRSYDDDAMLAQWHCLHRLCNVVGLEIERLQTVALYGLYQQSRSYLVPPSRFL